MRCSSRPVVLLVVFALTAASCSSSADDDSAAPEQAPFTALTAATGDRPSYLFVQRAGNGEISDLEDGTWQLSLTEVEDSVTSFTDRPIRSAVTMSNDDLVALWDDGQTFDAIAPNAAMEIHQEEAGRDIVVVEILDASISEEGLTYVFTVLEGQDQPEDGDRGPMSLFIDSAPGPADDGAAECDESEPTCATFLTPHWTDGTGWGSVGGFETIRTLDLDGDGNDELIGRAFGGLEAWAFDRTGCGDVERCGAWRSIAFGGPLSEASGGNVAESGAIGSGDFDGDGREEVWVHAGDSIQFWTIEEDTGSQGFFDWVQLGWDVLPVRDDLDAVYLAGIGSGDFDGDGRDELGIPGTSTVLLYTLSCPDGDESGCGADASWNATPTSGPSLDHIRHIRYADVDQNGKTDIYGWSTGDTCNQSTCSVVYWLNERWGGDPAASIEHSIPGHARWSLTAADFLPEDGLEFAFVRTDGPIQQIHLFNDRQGSARADTTSCLDATTRIVPFDGTGSGSPLLTPATIGCGVIEAVEYTGADARLIAEDLHVRVGPRFHDLAEARPAPALAASLTDGDVLVTWESDGIRTLRLEPTEESTFWRWRATEPVMRFDEDAGHWTDHTTDAQQLAYQALNRTIGIQERGGVRNQYDSLTGNAVAHRLEDVRALRGTDVPSAFADRLEPADWEAMVEATYHELDYADHVVTYFQSMRAIVATSTLKSALALDRIELMLEDEEDLTGKDPTTLSPGAAIVDGIVHGIFHFVGHEVGEAGLPIIGPTIAAGVEIGIEKALEQFEFDPLEEVSGEIHKLFGDLSAKFDFTDHFYNLAQRQTLRSIGRTQSWGRLLKAYPSLSNSSATDAAALAVYRAFDETAWKAVVPIIVEVHMCAPAQHACPWARSPGRSSYQDVVGVPLEGVEFQNWTPTLAYGMLRGHIDSATNRVRHLPDQLVSKLFRTGNFAEAGDETHGINCAREWTETCGFGWTPEDMYRDRLGFHKKLYCWSGEGQNKTKAPCW